MGSAWWDTETTGLGLSMKPPCPGGLAAGKPPRLEPLAYGPGTRAGKKMLLGYVDSFKSYFFCF